MWFQVKRAMLIIAIIVAVGLVCAGVYFLLCWIIGAIVDSGKEFIKADANYAYEVAEGDNDYYYNCLSENQQSLYESLHRESTAYMAGERVLQTAEADGNEDFVLGFFRYSDYGLTKKKAQSAVVAFINDCPSFFIFSGVEYIYNGRWIAPVVSQQFSEYAAVTSMQEKIDASVSAAAVGLEGKEEEAARFVYLYEYVLGSTEYARDESGEAILDGLTCSIAGALDGDENTLSVCQGYGRTVLYLCNSFGIDCLYVSSDAINHAWNIVEIGGIWYYADATNDDTIARSWESTVFCLCSESDFWTLFERNEPAFDTSEDGINWQGELPALSQERFGEYSSGGVTYRLWGSFREYYVDSVEPADRIVISSEVNGLPVTRVYTYAFNNSPDVREIVIPQSVVRMDSLVLRGCMKIEKLTLPFLSSSLKTLFGYSDGVPDTLEEVVIAGGSELAASACSDTSSLRFVSLPDGMTEIGQYAFENSGIESIVFPKELEFIGYYAFYQCSDLRAIYYKGSPSDWENIEIHSPSTNRPLLNAARYYYSQDIPPQDGETYWHYDKNGEIVLW